MTGDTLGATCALTDPFCPVPLPLINLGQSRLHIPLSASRARRPAPSSCSISISTTPTSPRASTRSCNPHSTSACMFWSAVDMRISTSPTTRWLRLLHPGIYVTDQTKFLPRAGVVVDLFKGISAFASYSEGMKWAGFVPVAQPKPEFSKQTEGGLKFNFNGQLSGTLAAFEIDRENVPLITGPGQATTTRRSSRAATRPTCSISRTRTGASSEATPTTDATFSDPTPVQRHDGAGWQPTSRRADLFGSAVGELQVRPELPAGLERRRRNLQGVQPVRRSDQSLDHTGLLYARCQDRLRRRTLQARGHGEEPDRSGILHAL